MKNEVSVTNWNASRGGRRNSRRCFGDACGERLCARATPAAARRPPQPIQKMGLRRNVPRGAGYLAVSSSPGAMRTRLRRSEPWLRNVASDAGRHPLPDSECWIFAPHAAGTFVRHAWRRAAAATSRHGAVQSRMTPRSQPIPKAATPAVKATDELPSQHRERSCSPASTVTRIKGGRNLRGKRARKSAGRAVLDELQQYIFPH